jgi:ribose/xylose/arabinose/galactoside ABC-type transport system permease subunit
MMAGLAGLLFCARNRIGDANSGVAYELDAIAMVVIGGTSLAGGKGSVGGTVLGALIMGAVINILGLKNVDANVQFVLKAVIIVLAVALQTRRADAE